MPGPPPDLYKSTEVAHQWRAECKFGYSIQFLTSQTDQTDLLSIVSPTNHSVVPLVEKTVMKRARGQSFEKARESKKSKGTAISLRILRDSFPLLLVTVNWAKARYRALSLFAPYVNTAAKLSVADTAYDFGLTKHTTSPTAYPDMPTRDVLIALARS